MTELGIVTRAMNAEALAAAGAARVAELEQLLEACRHHREIAEVAVEGLTSELAEARGELGALEMANEELTDDLERMAQAEKERDRA